MAKKTKHEFKLVESLRANMSLFVLSLSVPILLGLTVSLGVFFPAFILNENQILYLFSTTSQVISGLFGLTVAGYVFLRNELDRQSESDDSVAEAVAALKSKYFRLIGFLSVVGLGAISFSLLSIAAESSILSHNNLVAFINIAGSLSFIEVASILYFAFDMVDPNRIEKISTRIRKSFGQESDEKGSLEQFMKDFNELEDVLQSFFYSNKQSATAQSSRTPNISNAKLVNELLFRERIDFDFKEELLKLIRFRNSVVHGRELYVSSKDNQWVKGMLEQTKKKIEDKDLTSRST
jgi:hypothetical protein